MDREQALDAALGQIEREFGKGSVMRMSDRPQVSVGAVSTGSLALDLALGIGGLPRGRVVEIFGPESSGKTTLVYHVIAEAQRRGGICAFIDAEHAMDPSYAKRIGVNIDDLLVSQPDTGEQALEITELLIRSGALDVVAIDSVAALTPKAEIEGEMGDSHVGLQARMMSQAMRKLAGTLNRTDTICIFTNQLREKIGVMFGNPETTPGGRALKFYSSVRLDIRRIETLKEGVEAIGNRVRVKVAKNKVAPPFKQAEFDIIYGSGISWEGTVLDAGLERKVVQKSGSYFSFEDERLGQGRQNATAFLREHPDVTQAILQRIQAQLGDDQVVSARLLPIADAGRPGDGREEEGRSGRGRRRGAVAWSRPRSRSRRSACPRGRATEAMRSRSCARTARRSAPSTAPSGRSLAETTRRESCGRSSTRAGVSEAAQTAALDDARAGRLRRRRALRARAGRRAGRRGYGDAVDPRRPRAPGRRPPSGGRRDGRTRARARACAARELREAGGGLRALRDRWRDAASPRRRSRRLLRPRCRRGRRRSRIEELHLTFCLHTTHFRIESNPAPLNSDLLRPMQATASRRSST